MNRRETLSLVASTSILFQKPQVVNSFGLLPQAEKRQLELCIVTIIRTKYWVETISTALKNSLIDKDSNLSLKLYIEARLGSKALLTGKTGSGSNGSVYRLATFELRECLKDAVTYCEEDEKAMKKIQKKSKSSETFLQYCKSREADDRAQVIVESLAACLEFDGLDSLTDPSPRSSLMITQFRDDKAIYVERMLREQTIPACDAFLDSIFKFNNESSPGLKEKCYGYVKRYFSAEIPSSLLIQDENPSDSENT